jgi:hypothetical protein
MTGQFFSRAASREATTVDEEVTFWFISARNERRMEDAYNGRNGKVLLLGILEQTEDVIADDDAGLAGELLEDTHCV